MQTNAVLNSPLLWNDHDPIEEKTYDTFLEPSDDTFLKPSDLREQGISLFKSGMFRYALEINQKVLETMKRSLGSEHPEVLKTRDLVARCMLKLGQIDEALQEIRDVRLIRRETLGEKHPDMAKSWSNAGRCLHLLGRYKKAIEVYKRALAIREEVVKNEEAEENEEIVENNDPDIATYLANIGMCYYELKQYQNARNNLDQAYRIYQKIYQNLEEAERSPFIKTAGILNNLGLLMFKEGRFDEARRNHEMAYDMRKEMPQEDHPAMATYLNNIGTCWFRLGDHQKAQKSFEKAFAIATGLGENPEIAIYWNNMGILKEAVGQNEEALAHYKKAVKIACNYYTQEHPHIDFFLGNVLNVLEKIDNKGVKKATKKELLPLLKKYLGKKHACTCSLMRIKT